jgi:hypothetical protein
MKWWMLAVIVMAVVRTADAGDTGPAPSIDFQMRNESRLPPDVLRLSQEQVTRIFAGAGLVVRWTSAEPRLTVTVVPQALGYATALSPVMGVARRTASGSTVQVFLKQVQQFARAYDVELGTMLAHVIAHEIGHLLLPPNAHSSTGLMQPAWDKALVREAARGSLTFTEAQAAQIRASR